MLPLSFQSVTKRFDKTIAVDDLSLQVLEGELFFLLGPSGCGKTTCLRLVAGFYQPDGGELCFGERVMNRVPPHRRNTGMVFQNYALWPHLTARGNVEYGLRVRKVPRAERDKRVTEALEMVRLGQLGDRYPNQLSGGQQQRVALARALIIRPDVLLLDEPLSNLDAQLRLEMRREIKRLHEETGTTALYVTHDQEEALSIADRIAILKDGRLQQVGPSRELYRRPRSRFVAEFMGETNLLPGTLRRLDADGAVVETSVGELLAARPEGDVGGWQVGQSVWCSIRPESWRVVPQPVASSASGNSPEGVGNFSEKTNHLKARLESVMYLGQSEQYQVHLTDARESVAPETQDETWRSVKAAVMNPGLDVPRPGHTLVLSCAPEDVVLLAQ